MWEETGISKKYNLKKKTHKKVPVQLCLVHLVQEAGEEGVSYVVVEKRPLVHQDALDVLTEGRILTQQLYTRFSQNRLKANSNQNKLINPVGAEWVQLVTQLNTWIIILVFLTAALFCGAKLSLKCVKPVTDRAPSTVWGRERGEEEVPHMRSTHLRNRDDMLIHLYVCRHVFMNVVILIYTHRHTYTYTHRYTYWVWQVCLWISRSWWQRDTAGGWTGGRTGSNPSASGRTPRLYPDTHTHI